MSVLVCVSFSMGIRMVLERSDLVTGAGPGCRFTYTNTSGFLPAVFNVGINAELERKSSHTLGSSVPVI